MIQKATYDIVLIGGGITGLWALNRLRKLGYSVALFESRALGAGQTLKSQGIIHGGIKYALTGLLNKASQSIADMPKRWQNCLQGIGEIDLRQVTILSKDQLLWSTGSLTSDLTTFFASKALKSRVKTLDSTHYPAVLQNAAFKGKVYQLEEIVLDIPSLIKALSESHSNCIFKVDEHQGCQIKTQDNNIQTIIFQSSVTPDSKMKGQMKEMKVSDTSMEVSAKRYVFCAGEGNAQLLGALTNNTNIKMQRRPLQMVVVRLLENYPFYAHCLDNGVNPRITITSHTTSDGQSIWYLGGQIAEEGVNRSPEEQCRFAKQELKNLFPWINWETAEFASFFINRAEAEEHEGKRPDSFFLQPFGNAFAAWPTKLALAPLLCDKLIAYLEQENIKPSNSINNEDQTKVLLNFGTPTVGKPVWETLFQQELLSEQL